MSRTYLKQHHGVDLIGNKNPVFVSPVSALFIGEGNVAENWQSQSSFEETIASENISHFCNDLATARRSLYGICDALRDRVNPGVKTECHFHRDLFDWRQRNCCYDIFLKCRQPDISTGSLENMRRLIRWKVPNIWQYMRFCLSIHDRLLTHTTPSVKRILTTSRH
jgi:hypothetical protein